MGIEGSDTRIVCTVRKVKPKLFAKKIHSESLSNHMYAATGKRMCAANKARLRGERAEGAAGAAAGDGHCGHAGPQPAAPRVPRRLPRLRALPPHAGHRYSFAPTRAALYILILIRFLTAPKASRLCTLHAINSSTQSFSVPSIQLTSTV